MQAHEPRLPTPQFLYGMGEALSVRVGFHLGRRGVAEAKRVCAIAFACATVLSVMFSIVMIGAHNYIGRIFSDDPAVIELSSQVRITKLTL